MAQAPAGLKPVTDPNLLAQLNGVPSAQPGQSTVTPIFSAPKTPSVSTNYQMNPDGTASPIPGAPVEQWRTITPQEATQRGLPTGKVYQTNQAGEVKPIGDAPADGGPPDANTMSLAKLLVSNRLPVNGMSLRSPQMMKVLAAAQQIDPSFDPAKYQTRLAAIKSGAVGKLADSDNALNTAIAHAGMLWDQAQKIAGHNTGIGPLSMGVNRLSNYMDEGSPELVSYLDTAQKLGGEQAKAYGINTGSERGSMAQAFDPNLPLASKQAAIKNAMHLFVSKMAANLHQYNWGNMGNEKPSLDLLDPAARATLERIAPDVLGQYFSDKPDPMAAMLGVSHTGGGTPPQPPIDTSSQHGTDPSGGGDIGAPPPSNPLNPQQQTAYDGFWKANPNATAEQLKAFGQSIGVNIGNAEQIIAARDKGAGVLGADAAVSGLTPEQQAEVARRQQGTDAAGAFVNGVGDTVTMGTLPKLAASADALVQSLGGNGAIGDNYTRNLATENAYQSAVQSDHPVAYPVGQVAGGLVLPTGEVTGAADAAKVGAGYGAAYGAGSQDTLSGAATGALTGGATGAAVGALANKIVGGVGKWAASRSANTAATDTMAAAARQGIDPIPADVGGTVTRRLSAAAMQGPLSAQPIVKGAQRVTEQAQAARDRIAAELGQAADADVTGQKAIDGAQNFITRTSKRGGALYDQAKALAGDAQVPLTRATEALDQNIAELSQTPGGSIGLETLKALRDQIAGKQFSVVGIRGMRTQLRDNFISQGLRGSDLERRVNQVVRAASEDMTQGLAEQGLSNAASAFKTSDRYWAARVNTIDNALEPILGKDGSKGPQAVFQALTTAAKGDSGKLARFIRALPETDQADVRASFIGQLGRGTAGTQNSEGTVFSLPQFLTHWNQIPEASKAVLFTGESRAALNDLAKVAEGTKAAQKYQNHSNTGGAVLGQALLTGGLTFAGGLQGLVLSTGAQYLSGKVLASPKFARWLARAPQQGMASSYISRLDKIAATEPGIAQEILPLKDMLMRAANDNVTGRAAASGPGQGDQQNEGSGGQPGPTRRQ